MEKGICGTLVIAVLILFPILISAQQQEPDGGDITYEAYGSPGRVTFGHQTHVYLQQLICTDCHDQLFNMKRGEASMLQCTACHNGEQAFSNRDQAGCTNCHK